MMMNLLFAAVLALGASPSENRAAIQREIDAASAAGGGRVTIPAGIWPTGSIELKSGVELHLAKGAVLKGSTKQADYNADDVFPENFHSVGEEWSGGHLSNDQACELVRKFASPRLRKIFLAHLSHQCNARHIAICLMKETLREIGRADIELEVAS